MFCHDQASDLQAIIAIHSTALGPAAGGCRMHPYQSVDDAIADVLRLSKGMSYKNAMAGLPLGGGKCVIIADPDRPDKPELLRQFSKHVQQLGGRFWTAIDIGVSPADADVLAENCDYIFARASQYPKGFDPSAFTALGCFSGIRAVVEHCWNRSYLHGLRVAVQGLGATGADLTRQLCEAGAQVIVADIDDSAVQSVMSQHDVTPVPSSVIHMQDVDVFAPCAMGGVINDQTLAEIKARAICGVANNQLAEDSHGIALHEAGICYVPDYVVNAGGIMAAGAMIYSSPTMDDSRQRAQGLYDTVLELLKKSETEGLPCSEACDGIARARIGARVLG